MKIKSIDVGQFCARTIFKFQIHLTTYSTLNLEERRTLKCSQYRLSSAHSETGSLLFPNIVHQKRTQLEQVNRLKNSTLNL